MGDVQVVSGLLRWALYLETVVIQYLGEIIRYVFPSTYHLLLPVKYASALARLWQL